MDVNEKNIQSKKTIQKKPQSPKLTRQTHNLGHDT
jgi:hypothetical protein